MFVLMLSLLLTLCVLFILMQRIVLLQWNCFLARFWRYHRLHSRRYSKYKIKQTLSKHQFLIPLLLFFQPKRHSLLVGSSNWQERLHLVSKATFILFEHFFHFHVMKNILKTKKIDHRRMDFNHS